MPQNIVRRIAAAAAEGFESATAVPQPRTPGQWVAHCRTAAERARAAILANPPLRDDAEADQGSTLRRLSIALLRVETQPGEEQQLHELEQEEADDRISGQELQAAAQRAASVAFRACIPLLTSQQATRCYIACVAAGCMDGHLNSQEGKTLLYNAQLALSAYKRGPKRKGKS